MLSAACSPSDAPPRQMRWLRWLAAALAPLLIAAVAVYVWASHSTDTSTIARALVWMNADVGDQHRFPARAIPAGGHPSRLLIGPRATLRVTEPGDHGLVSLDSALRGTHTRAFVVVHHGRVVFERYDGGANRRTLETSFSVAKSLVSTLVGIATEQGHIDSVDDPVTKYLPELARRDPRFGQVTLRDLLTMSSGISYRETSVLGIPWLWRDPTYSYYGVDLRQVALRRTEIAQPPGRWHYNNYNPLLLGLVLERATGMSVSAYMSKWLWRPLGGARDATWSLDSKRSGFEKMESGVNATALDYARFGQLFLHRGSWNGRRIISGAWVHAATSPHKPTDYPNPYGYFWWIDGARPGRFYAFGNYGQYVYVDPHADTVIVRLGSDWGHDNEAWLALFRKIVDQLDRAPHAAAGQVATSPDRARG